MACITLFKWMWSKVFDAQWCLIPSSCLNSGRFSINVHISASIKWTGIDSHSESKEYELLTMWCLVLTMLHLFHDQCRIRLGKGGSELVWISHRLMRDCVDLPPASDLTIIKHIKDKFNLKLVVKPCRCKHPDHPQWYKRGNQKCKRWWSRGTQGTLYGQVLLVL